MSRKWLELATAFFLALYTLGSLYVVISLATGLTVDFRIIAVCTVAFFAFAALHSGLALGVRHTAVFLCVSFVVCLVFELLGTSRGWIYGSYYYTDRLGPKVLGLVPLLIPLAWFMMMYASYNLANVLVGERAQRGRSVATDLWLVFLSSIIMTSWDLMNDPVNVNGGHWVWLEGGPYFGIPISNYVGWLLTTLVVFALYRWFEWTFPPPGSQAAHGWFSWLPTAGFTITMLSNAATLLIIDQPAPAMVGLFSMGAFVAAAISCAASVREAENKTRGALKETVTWKS